MGGCHSTTAIEPMPQKGFCMCGAKAFGKTLNHTLVEHELANIVLQYYRKKLNSEKELGGYLWTLQFIKCKFRNQCINALVEMDDFPQNLFPRSMLFAWANNANTYSNTNRSNYFIQTI